MLIYIIILFFFFLLVIRYDVNHVKQGRNVFFVLEAVILILLFGLRYRVGGDSLLYEDNWYKLPNLSDLQGKDAFDHYSKQPLYYIFVAIIKELGGGFVAFQIVHAIIVNTVFFKIIKQYCTHIFTAVIFYFCIIAFNSNTEILREALAVAVFLLSLKYLMAHKWIPYYICCIIAFNFHISAVICFLIPFLLKFCTKQWRFSRLIPILVVLGVLSFVYVQYLPSLLSFVFTLLSSFNMDKMEIYTSMLGSNNVNGYILSIINVSIILFFAYAMRKNNLNSPIQNLAMNMTFIFTAMNMIIPIMGSRWAGYFSILYYICIADLLYSFRGKNGSLKLLTYLFLYFITFTTIRTQLAPDPWAPSKIPTYQRYIPYHSVFDKQKEPDREASVREIYDI